MFQTVCEKGVGSQGNVQISLHIYAVFAMKLEDRRQTMRTCVALSLYRIETIIDGLHQTFRSRSVPSMCIFFPRFLL